MTKCQKDRLREVEREGNCERGREMDTKSYVLDCLFKSPYLGARRQMIDDLGFCRKLVGRIEKIADEKDT